MNIKKILINLIILIGCYCVPGEALTEADPISIIHSQDRKSLREEIVKTIKNAEQSILVLTFTLSDPEIIELLHQKANEGINVKVIIDKDHMQPITAQSNSKIQLVTRLQGEGRVHHKILVVDEKYVWMGSANFTKAAYATQENLMIGFFSQALAQVIYKEADVFCGLTTRSVHTPPVFFIGEQIIHMGLLPHDGFPSKNCESAINASSKKLLLTLIEEAKDTLYISMMAWTDLDLAHAVKEAHKRGVQIKILAADYEGVIPQLMQEGINVGVNASFTLMHNKFMYIDHKILVNGSANFSKSSFTRNDESYIVINQLTSEQKKILDNYWNYLWPNSL